MHLTYYFWINSDWAYLGGPRLESISKRHDVAVDFRPMRLLEIYKRTDGIPLSQRSPQRQAERIWELRRWRTRLGMIWGQDRLDFLEEAVIRSKLTKGTFGRG
jgi:2-hydroxychromene-2-carboxylate isomerase